MKKIWKCCLFVVSVFLLVVGAVWHLPEIVTVSNNVYGKELPIQSVETEEKKAVLTFECAWNHSSIKDILEILEDHNVVLLFLSLGTGETVSGRCSEDRSRRARYREPFGDTSEHGTA